MRTAGADVVQQAMSDTASTSTVAARLQQIKESLSADAGPSKLQGSAADAPAGPSAAEPAAATSPMQQQQHRRHVKINPESTIIQQQEGLNGGPGSSKPSSSKSSPKPSAADLTSVSTSQGPIVMTTPEEVAQAQQALRLLHTYDFKIYGQGLSAGATAVPIEPPGEKVLYKPEAVAPEPPLPPSMAAAAAANRTAANGSMSDTNTSAAAAAGAGGGDKSGDRVGGSFATTPSGTPTVLMQPLPDNGTAAVGDAYSSSRAAATAAPTSETLDQTLDQAPDSRQQQHGANSAGLHRRKLQQQQQQQPYYQSAAGPQRRITSRTARSKSSSSSSKMGRCWRRTKTRLREGVEDAAAWLVHMMCIVALWLLKIMVKPLGAVFGPWYQYNRRIKEQQRDMLSRQQIDLSDLHTVLGALPSWLSGIGGATEKLTWLNQMLVQVWPVLDPVVCELIRSTVEPMLDDMKPPFIAAMGFQKLTLGELPLELEGIRVVGGDYQGKAGRSECPDGGIQATIAAAAADDDDRIELEIDFRWVGEPNISFFVELAMAGPYTRMVPKLSHLTARGTIRLGLTRLVPQLPGFGAIMVSMARTPQVKFSLDFGPALGGKFTAKPVAAFLDPFIRDTLANLLVWPNRFVVPVLPRNVTGNLDDLTLHSQGVLEVEVISARHLPKKGGAMSTVDPQVQLWTQPQHHVFTSVKKGSRNPNWGQKHELLVQEPDSQLLRVILNDIDMLNVKELLRVNLLKGASKLLRSARPIGRTALPLRDICNKPFQRQELELRLSSSEWAYELGVLDEHDDSTLNLALTYKPFIDLDAASTKTISIKGVLFVDVRQCEDLPAGDYSGGSSDPYIFLKVAGQKQQTIVMPNTHCPVYNAHYEFYNVQAQDVLQVQVYDKDTFKYDDLLGQVELPVTAIVDWSQGGKRGWRDGWWKLKGGRKGKKEGDFGRIEMKVQFRPY